jgi:hypothetical protein
MELITPRPGSVASAVVELEGPRGRMKIEFKGVATAELNCTLTGSIGAGADGNVSAQFHFWRLR